MVVAVATASWIENNSQRQKNSFKLSLFTVISTVVTQFLSHRPPTRVSALACQCHITVWDHFRTRFFLFTSRGVAVITTCWSVVTHTDTHRPCGGLFPWIHHWCPPSVIHSSTLILHRSAKSHRPADRWMNYFNQFAVIIFLLQSVQPVWILVKQPDTRKEALIRLFVLMRMSKCCIVADLIMHLLTD